MFKKSFCPGWKTSANRREHQRALNRAMRRVNKAIEEDSLWRGRFVVRQKDAQFYRYEDKSGYEMYITLEFRDKKNGAIYEFCDCANSLLMWSGSKIFYEMNRFITEIDDVWVLEGHEALYADTTDYTKWA